MLGKTLLFSITEGPWMLTNIAECWREIHTQEVANIQINMWHTPNEIIVLFCWTRMNSGFIQAAEHVRTLDIYSPATKEKWVSVSSS